MKLHHLALVASSGLFLAACTIGPFDSEKIFPMSGSSAVSKTILLTEQNKLGQSGQAVISEGPNGNAVVTITMTGGTFPDPQPAHIHVGSCPNPGAVKYPLTNLVGGKSVTTLDASYDEVVNPKEKMAINIHKSAAESKVYTACGNVN